jgi:hypothetical protein
MTRHPATTRNRSHSAAHTGHRTGPRAGLRLRPLLRDLLSVGLATLFASGAAFSLGVLVPRVLFSCSARHAQNGEGAIAPPIPPESMPIGGAAGAGAAPAFATLLTLRRTPVLFFAAFFAGRADAFFAPFFFALFLAALFFGAPFFIALFLPAFFDALPAFFLPAFFFDFFAIDETS